MFQARRVGSCRVRCILIERRKRGDPEFSTTTETEANEVSISVSYVDADGAAAPTASVCAARLLMKYSFVIDNSAKGGGYAAA